MSSGLGVGVWGGVDLLHRPLRQIVSTEDSHEVLQSQVCGGLGCGDWMSVYVDTVDSYKVPQSQVCGGAWVRKV